jgi:hemolysin activation/secretion protein
MTRNEFALRLPQPKSQQLTKILGTLEAYTALDFGHVFAQNSFGIAGGDLTGGTIGLRRRGGRVSFDVAWSDIIASSSNLDAAVAKSGLVYARVNLSF